ncbi:hypothetical protein [Pectobacterium versatile]|uniref:hypothetical protein n=1 Tax=Pectobacterium versatile TaxID=2488639 RepID=UPI001CCBD345|nr:hypothetical protein [Pectobacterium versatile]
MTIGFVKSALDAHTLGISTVASLIEECGFKTVIASAAICKTVDHINDANARYIFIEWLKENNISSLGYSYRLDPVQGYRSFSMLINSLHIALAENKLRRMPTIFFAGLPKTCELVQEEYGNKFELFSGDETPIETLIKLKIPENLFPSWLISQSKYDDGRMSFAIELIDKGDYHQSLPLYVPPYENYAKFSDNIIERLGAVSLLEGSVLCRAHVGPYLEDRLAALAEFDSWLKVLSEAGQLDIISVGSSQLTQERFGLSWDNLPNGGGVPINSEKEFRYVRNSAKSMLVRAYSGTKNIPEYAQMMERTINCAWHALSLWWFNKADGRGPLSVEQCLKEHVNTLAFIGKFNKPFEPNVAHHFSFRGSDDLTAIIATYLAVAVAKLQGVKDVILQTMLNTPKITSGIADLVKFRTILRLVRPLCDANFRIHVQPRAGLAYFSPNLYKAKCQLAAVSCMMDDIEPNDANSPSIVHVVSYSEAVELASPPVINESVKITRHAIKEYRRLGVGRDLLAGDVSEEINYKVSESLGDAILMIKHMEKNTPQLYSAKGLYEVYRKGYFAVPSLWDCREELKNAVSWKTKVIDGSTQVVDEQGNKISMSERLAIIDVISKIV